MTQTEKRHAALEDEIGRLGRAYRMLQDHPDLQMTIYDAAARVANLLADDEEYSGDYTHYILKRLF